MKPGAWLIGVTGALVLHGLLGLLPAPSQPAPYPVQAKLTLRLLPIAAPALKASAPAERPAAPKPAMETPAPPPRRRVAAAQMRSSPAPKPAPTPAIKPAPDSAIKPALQPEPEPEGSPAPGLAAPTADVRAEAGTSVLAAGAAVEAGPAPPPPAPPQDLGPARRAILASIQAQERYPRQARRLRQQGVVKVQVILTSQGALKQPPQVQASCGHRLLDREALRMVQAAAPFAPLPSGHTQAQFVLPIRFALR